MELGNSLGQSIDEVTLKKGLMELNPGIHFDVGGNLDLIHPMRDIRQGVWYNGRHMAPMDRGMIPEFKVWACREQKYFDEAGTLQKRMIRTHILRIGWQHTFDRLIRRGIPGVTRESLSKKFNLPIKFYLGSLGDIQSIDYGKDYRE